MQLSGKKILFFAPAFFGYEIKIAEKMKQLGAEVDFFDERSINRSFEKALLKINPAIFKRKTEQYYNNIIDKKKHINYDYILIIKCEMISLSTLDQLKNTFSNAKLCLYLYDSLKNIKGIKSKLSKFDRIVSFDLQDCQQNKQFLFRPLFYLDVYKKPMNKDKVYTYDLNFIGTIHSDRYAILKEIKKHCEDLQLNTYFFFFLQGKFIYYFYKLIKKEFRDTTIHDFDFQKVDSTEISKIIDGTNVIVDIQHPKQSGLTMRTIEILGMNKKLITTNTEIKKYDFYNENNILIIDRHNIKIPKSFFLQEYTAIPEDIYNKYSIEQWVYDVLGVETNVK